MAPEDPALARARQMLETGGNLPRGALPADISESWARSLAQGLDPLGRGNSLVLTEVELDATRRQYADLIGFARPELELLYDQIAGSNFMIALGSPDGVVLETLHDNQFADSEAGGQIIPGSVWREDLRGTNAMGMTITTNRPAQVYGGEHFFRSQSNVSCISAPIFDGRGDLAGVLDASSMSGVRQQHTAALVQMAATSIENSLIRSCHDQRIVLQFHPRQEYLGTLSSGMLVLDEDLTVHGINRKGEMFLTGLRGIHGETFDRIFETPFASIQRRLAEGETLRIRDRMGSAVSLRCVANRASFALARRLVPAEHVASAPQSDTGPDRNLFRDVVIEDPDLWRRLRALPAAAKRGLSVFVTGETGTGKEIIARLAHAATGRAGPFVVLDGRMVQDDSFSALCFGADGQQGLLERASGGTLFLDEASHLPAAAQAALARVLDLGEFRHPQSGDLLRLDLRVVTALTTGDAAAELLPALRYRLEGFRLELPPLRARGDLEALALRFLRTVRPDARLTPDALARLRRHNWPGNLHELRSVMAQAALMRSQGACEAADFDGLLPRTERIVPSADACPRCAGVPWKARRCQTIRSMVAQQGGNVSRAARQLGMSRTTVYNHLDLAMTDGPGG